LELPLWSAMVVSSQEVVFTHNFGFRPTGILREAYVSYVNELYAREARGIGDEDISVLKINDISSWLRAWQFMKMCGFAKRDGSGDSDANPG
jgi:hypothetical protein